MKLYNNLFMIFFDTEFTYYNEKFNIKVNDDEKILEITHRFLLGKLQLNQLGMP